MRIRPISIATLLAFTLGFAASGCGDSSTSTGNAPPPSDRSMTTPAAPRAADPPPAPTTPPSPASASPTTPSGPHDPAAGEALYAQNCASCHGARGGADGPIGIALNPKPARHDDGAYMNTLSNEHLFRVIKQGGASVGKSALMAPWGGSFSDEQIWDLVAYVRTLAKPPYTGPKP
jgi:mono/diheme cytochrome c family protein